MGTLAESAANDTSLKTSFIKHLLNDVKCLELVLQHNMIESGTTRIGAEQEFCLITKNQRPQRNADEILKAVNDPHFTPELARFNLEINLDPHKLEGSCFSQIENQLNKLLALAKDKAADYDTDILLTGILPTICKNELTMEYMTPMRRFQSLNQMVKGMRGSDFQLYIQGVDDLAIKHDSILMEACNTSFQMHLQVDPEDFIDSYNWAQAIAGPVLGVSANSPILLGRELWNETRIALFQQSIDTRNYSHALKDQSSRVNFGQDWEYGTIADLYKNEIANHKIILAGEVTHDSLGDLENGKIPKLQALNTHNGTIYRWNRACYGSTEDAAHLRIENRYVPAGPTIKDQMANFAFWVGLMMGRSNNYGDVTTKMEFEDVKGNFVKAARTGIQSVLKWNGRFVPIKDLITRELLPMAYDGLQKVNVDKDEAQALLQIIDQRLDKQTGAQWIISSYRELKKTYRKDDALLNLTKSMLQNQESGLPVHEWPPVTDHSERQENATQLGHIMSTKLFTVKADDPAELATQLMIWKNIHHIPVEGENNTICGILTWTHMQHFQEEVDTEDLTVADIMNQDVILAHSEMSIEEGTALMKQNEIGCLPIVHNQYLIGIVTIKDLATYEQSESA